MQSASNMAVISSRMTEERRMIQSPTSSASFTLGELRLVTMQ